MKTKLLIVSCVLFFWDFTVCSAQTETRLGGMLTYGTEIENIGIGVNAEFPIIEDLTISPGIIYFLPREEFGADLSWWELNGNANYYFLSNESMSLYGLGGLNYSHVKIKYDGNGWGGSSEASDGEFGLNLGAGANFEIGSSFVPFAEAKYVIIDGGQLVIAAGVRFNL